VDKNDIIIQMTEGEQQIPRAESAPKGLVPEKYLAFKGSLFFGTEDELNSFKEGLKDLSDPEREIGERVLKLHRIMAGLSTSSLQGELEEIYKTAKDNNLPDDNELFVFAASVLSTEIGQRMTSSGQGRVVGGEERDPALNDLLEINRQLLKATTGQLELQKQQMELLRRSGFSGFVSAMQARAGINVQQFDTEPPVWYDRLSDEWKRVVRTNLGILMGAYLKFRSPGQGAELIIKSEDIRIEREALAFMWENLPGFRMTIATIVSELFEDSEGKMVLTKDGKDKLADTPAYISSLLARLKKYFSENPDSLMLYSQTLGPEDINPDVAARFAVSAAFNLLYLGGAFESGDLGKGLKDSYSFNPSVRTFCLPRDQARSKYISGEEDIIGTDEAWGGKLGEWFAERIRHKPQFKQDFLNNKGITRLMPQRLMYSLFDLTYFKNGETLSKALLSILSPENRREISGMVDYTDPNLVNFRDLKYPELWGGYSDLMDSAFKVYQAIIGKADKEFDRQALANSLSKLRKDPTLKGIYTGENGEWVVLAALTSLLGGPNLYSSEILLRLPDESYDYSVWEWLDDDRVLAALPSGARERIFRALNAKNLDSTVDAFSSLFSGSFLGRRESLRRRIRKEQKRWR